MKAVRIDEPGLLRLVEIDPPRPGRGEVVVDVAYAGVCGSDVELFTGGRPRGFVQYPVVPGHEWAGTVSATGRGVDNALVGRKVVAEGFRSCGSCAACLGGDPTLCDAGYDEIGFTRPGAWAEQLAVGADQLHLLSCGADLRSAAGIEPAACAAQAVERAAAAEGEMIAVVGGGTIGLLAAQLLLAGPPVELVVFEPSERRRGLATGWGVTAKHPRDINRCADRFDVVIEAAGATDTARASIQLARRGGRVVLAGIPDAAATIAVHDVVAKRLRLDTVFGAPRHAWRRAVTAFEAGVLDPGLLVTHELDITDAATALRLLTVPDDHTGKVLLRP